ERRGRTSAGIIPEAQRPEPVDHQRAAVHATNQAVEFSGCRIKCGDLSAAEIADENHVAESAEAGGGECDAPGSVEPGAPLQTFLQDAGRRKDIDVAFARAMRFVDRACFLLRKRDIDPGADALYIERSVVGGKLP